MSHAKTIDLNPPAGQDCPQMAQISADMKSIKVSPAPKKGF
jgi:hypothetical protein